MRKMVLRHDNAKQIDFPKKSPRDEGAAIFLPARRDSEASLFYSSGKLMVSGRMAKGETRDINQDSAAIFCDGNVAVLAIADGFSEKGHVFSEGLLMEFLSECIGAREHLASGSMEISTLVENSISRYAQRARGSEIRSSGVSFMASITRLNGETAICSPGDCSGYVFNKGDSEAVPSHTIVWDPNQHIKQSIFLLPQEEFYQCRKYPLVFVDSNSILGQGGRKGLLAVGLVNRRTLGKNGRFAMGSDGIVANLAVSVDEDGKMMDASGTRDLLCLLERDRTSEGGKGTLGETFSEIESRIRKKLEGPSEGSGFYAFDYALEGARHVIIPHSDDRTLLVVERL